MPDGLSPTFEETGVGMIAAERDRQIRAEGYSVDHDDGHDLHELALAAVAYAAPDNAYVGTANEYEVAVKEAWPWHSDEDKRDRVVRRFYAQPLATVLKEDQEVRTARLRELVKAGALIAAEIDRIQRLAR